MFVVTQKIDNYVIAITDNLTVNEDGTFTDVTGDVIYNEGDYQFYENVEVNPGIHPFNYSYTPETGFKLEFNPRDVLNAQVTVLQYGKSALDSIRQAENAAVDLSTLQNAVLELFEVVSEMEV